MSEKDRQQESYWHLDKKVSLSHIVTTVVAIVAAIQFFTMQNERISLVEKDQIYLKSSLSRVEQQQKEQVRQLSERMNVMESRIREDLKELNSSIITLIERGQ